MNKKISVIFDMDGTLLDTQRIYIPAWEYAGKIQGITGVGECIYHVAGMNEDGWSDYLLKKYEQMDLDIFKEDMKEYIVKNGKLKFKEGAIELINYLKENGVKIAVASGSSKEVIKNYFKLLSVTDLFDVIVGGDDVENGKPAPDIFIKAAQELGVSESCCFVFEDSKNGIKAGYDAGMKCIGVPDIVSFDDSAREMMFAEISKLSEGVEILKKFI
ncbi:MAG: HAD family phosphatase [Ruminococcaceae bacterium]|nr:HAD family phosphatase [Oscillospiraceae bacterium]